MEQEEIQAPLGEHHGGSFKAYMRGKVYRLHEQVSVSLWVVVVWYLGEESDCVGDEG